MANYSHFFRYSSIQFHGIDSKAFSISAHINHEFLIGVHYQLYIKWAEWDPESKLFSLQDMGQIFYEYPNDKTNH